MVNHTSLCLDRLRSHGCFDCSLRPCPQHAAVGFYDSLRAEVAENGIAVRYLGDPASLSSGHVMLGVRDKLSVVGKIVNDNDTQSDR